MTRSSLTLVSKASVGALVVLLGAGTGCPKKQEGAVARLITSRADLIGGPGALGDVGDYLLANDKIHVIVQNAGFSRGFGVYGGALIDADLVRPGRSRNSSGGGDGLDNFGEMFPAMFLKAMGPRENGISIFPDPAKDEVSEDGSAKVTVTGTAEEFLFMLRTINDVIVGGDDLLFQNEYLLRPGKAYVEITTRVINQGNSTVRFPGRGVDALTDGAQFELPTGDVILFGAGNEVFSPGAGFDMRFTLEALYKTPPELPALPGLVTPFVATKGPGVSYGFASGVTDEALSFVKRSGYDNAKVDDMLIPFTFSAFIGSFYGAAPRNLKPKEEFAFKKYFIVGDGDVAAIRDVVHDIRETKVGTVSGRVRQSATAAVEAGVQVVTYDGSGAPYSQHTTDDNGQFTGTYEPGRYTYVLTAEGRYPTKPVAFEVNESSTTRVEAEIALPGMVAVTVVGEQGRTIPAKCSFVGTYGFIGADADPAKFLYDRKLGEHMRFTDLVPDSHDPKTREFIEKVVHTAGRTGNAKLRPGKYRVVCSRGIEYTIHETKDVEVKPGNLSQVTATLSRAINTDGWAGGDYHLHQINSLDSFFPLDRRVIEVASEGVDIALSSDHNFVTDLSQPIAAAGLDDFLQSMIGLEMTTLEIGHFNAFPLRYDPGPITKGAFEWSGRTPGQIFESLRNLGAHGPDATIVQVNHPRDTILGYFNDYSFNQDTGEPEDDDSLFLLAEGPEFGPENFSFDFDAIEVYNGKHFELLHSYRVPAELPPPPLPEIIPPAGEILRDAGGNIAFPGGMEDWFVLLNQGLRYTGMGNSDSHDDEEEPGYPRTYVPVSNDNPGEISEAEVVAAIKTGRAMATNGPFVRVDVGGKGMGETADGNSGSVTVQVRIDTAPWIDFDTVSFVVNGEIVHVERGNRTSLATLERTINVTADSWVIIEVEGKSSLWPVVAGLEVPSLQISDAVGGIAGSFGIDLNPFGNLQPVERSVTHAYAFTNPVFIDGDGDGAYMATGSTSRNLEAARKAPRSSAKQVDARKLPTILRMFSVFSAH